MKKLIQKGSENKIYDNLNYEDLNNYISYYYQYDLIIKSKPKSILEIGVGTKLLSSYLKARKLDIKTCDFDSTLNPDIVGDIRKLPIKDNKFDTVVAFEVLEHLPFNYFKKSLLELRRVSKKYVIISIPYATLNIYFILKLIPFIRPRSHLFRITELWFLRHKFEGEHYWEMGKKNYSKKLIIKIIKSTGLKIVKEFSEPLNPYHYFFVLEK